MSIAIVTTGAGINGWMDVIELARTVRRFEPDVPVVAVDGSPTEIWSRSFSHVTVIHQPGANCSEGQNVGIAYASENYDPDWYIIIDVDTACFGSFSHLFDNLDEKAIYGSKFHKGHMGIQAMWIDGWIYAFHRSFWSTVGMFDPQVQGSGFEDLDICMAATNQGYRLLPLGFPFMHKEAGRKREITSEYEKVRLANIAYVRKKWNL